MLKDEKRAQLAMASDARHQQVGILWTTFGVFAAANALLLGFLLDREAWDAETAVIAVAGFLISWVWFLLHRRAIGHVLRLEGIVRAIEDDPELAIPRYLRVGGPPVLDERPRNVRALLLGGLRKEDEAEGKNPYLDQGPPARWVMHLTILLVMAAWLVVPTAWILRQGLERL